jgi:hypothetical protein
MIVVRIEIWPGGDSRGLREIDRLTIVNVGPDRKCWFVYEARHQADVARLRHRRQQGVDALLTKAFAALLEEGVPDVLADAAACEANLEDPSPYGV